MKRRLSSKKTVLQAVIVGFCLVGLVAALLITWPFHPSQALSQAAQSSTTLPPGTASTPGAVPQQSGGEPFRTCATCHPDYLSQPGPSADLIFSHPLHLKKDIKCETCHPVPLGHFMEPAPLMTTCLSCHQGKTATNDCKSCHRKLDEIAPGLGQNVVHLKPDPKTAETCDKCHDVKTWCEKRHGLRMPHPVNWQAVHGQAARTSAQVCVKCHQSQDETFCVRCHGVEMPHPAYWYSQHGDIAKNNESVCSKCHPSKEQYCDQCHHAGFSPTPQWEASQHGAVVKQRGTSECFVCHQQADCEECHPKGLYQKP